MNQVLTGTSFAKMRHERGFATTALVPLPPQVAPAPSTDPPNVPEATTCPIPTERGNRHDGPTRELLEARRGISYRDITGEREADLIRRYKAGDRHAGEILLLAYRKPIAIEAKKWKHRRSQLPWEDAFAEAQLRFLDAVREADMSLGTRLMSFASFYVMNGVVLAEHEQGNTVYVPTHVWHGVNVPKSESRIEHGKAMLHLGHLDAIIGDDGYTLADTVKDDANNPEDEMARCEFKHMSESMIREAMASLPSLQLDVIMRHIDGETLESISLVYGKQKRWAYQRKREAFALIREFLLSRGGAAREVVDEYLGRHSPIIDFAIDPGFVSGTLECRICGHRGHHTRVCERWAGKKIGRLTVVRGTSCKRLDNGKRSGTSLLVECNCGTKKVVRAGHVASGKVVSCGCWRGGHGAGFKRTSKRET